MEAWLMRPTKSLQQRNKKFVPELLVSISMNIWWAICKKIQYYVIWVFSRNQQMCFFQGRYRSCYLAHEEADNRCLKPILICSKRKILTSKFWTIQTLTLELLLYTYQKACAPKACGANKILHQQHITVKENSLKLNSCAWKIFTAGWLSIGDVCIWNNAGDREAAFLEQAKFYKGRKYFDIKILPIVASHRVSH